MHRFIDFIKTHIEYARDVGIGLCRCFYPPKTSFFGELFRLFGRYLALVGPKKLSGEYSVQATPG